MLIVAQTNSFLLDVAKAPKLDSASLESFFARDVLGRFCIEIPNYITNNSDKKAYKAGFLAELFQRLYPDMSKVEIYEKISSDYQMFIEVRQFQNYLKKFKKEKYTTFIQN